jgi:hypothetical protein
MKTLMDTYKATDYIVKVLSKSLIDMYKGLDYVSKTISKSILDSFVGEYSTAKTQIRTLTDSTMIVDYVSKTSCKCIFDVGRTVDWYSKTAYFVKPLIDTMKGIDYTGKSVSKSIMDWFVGEHAPSRTLIKNFAESLKVSEVFMKEIEKLFKEYVIVRDAPYRKIILTLIDSFIGEYYTGRGYGITISDEALMRDLITKVGFTISGYATRRVYYLPVEYKNLWDIIEDSEHNTKVAICKALLDKFKSIRDKLK